MFAYVATEPFWHAVGMLDKDDCRKAFVHDWPGEMAAWKHYAGGKRSIQPSMFAADNYGHILCLLADEIERLTGIQKLINALGLAGGGLCETSPGGNLGIHVDFNREGELYRRFNVLLYLNPDWQPSHGGQLELWSSKDSGPFATIAPTLGTLVAFESSDRSWHGHPTPVATEAGPRRSVAWYFFTREKPEGYVKDHSTIYRDREVKEKRGKK